MVGPREVEHDPEEFIDESGGLVDSEVDIRRIFFLFILFVFEKNSRFDDLGSGSTLAPDEVEHYRPIFIPFIHPTLLRKFRPSTSLIINSTIIIQKTAPYVR